MRRSCSSVGRSASFLKNLFLSMIQTLFDWTIRNALPTWLLFARLAAFIGRSRCTHKSSNYSQIIKTAKEPIGELEKLPIKKPWISPGLPFVRVPVFQELFKMVYFRSILGMEEKKELIKSRNTNYIYSNYNVIVRFWLAAADGEDNYWSRWNMNKRSSMFTYAFSANERPIS